MLRLNLANIQDGAVKQAFESLVEQLNSVELLRGEWDYIEYTANGAINLDVKLNHRLKFRPIDIIELNRDTGISSVNYVRKYFTPTTVYFTITGTGTIRLLVGKHNRGG